MIKINGAQYKQIEKEPWNKDWYVDDISFLINGKEIEDGEWPDIDTISDTDIISVGGGQVLFIEGCEDRPNHKTYEQYIKAWIKKQATAVFVVECDKQNEENLKQAIKKLGGKII